MSLFLFQRFFLLEDQAYSNTKVSMPVNTSQLELTRVRNDSTQINRSMKRVNTNQHESHESTPINSCSTRINKNQHKSETVNMNQHESNTRPQ